MMKRKRTGIRTCVVCREKRYKREMMRLVTDSEGRIITDPDGTMAGRGAYVCRTPECFRGLDKIRISRWKHLFRREDVFIALEELNF